METSGDGAHSARQGAGRGGQGRRGAWRLPPSGMQEAAALQGGRGEAGRPGFLGGGESGFGQAGGGRLVVSGWVLSIRRSWGQRDCRWAGRGLRGAVRAGCHLAAAQPTCGRCVFTAAQGGGGRYRELTALSD